MTGNVPRPHAAITLHTSSPTNRAAISVGRRGRYLLLILRFLTCEDTSFGVAILGVPEWIVYHLIRWRVLIVGWHLLISWPP